ncbi:penicillin-binding protein activator [Desulfobacterium sp. N47]|uniref:Leucine-binding protein domain-containing protein n=1 Tax=uncultured Desulfobacterium sp. TaxID=201089 RepID=E1YIJ3_9BACT|nr:hypothetical protein N47_D28490 [uncultured Desulfobacterium sp.]
MKKCIKLLIIPVLFALLACIPKAPVADFKVPDVKVDDTRGKALFSKAENLFSTQKYNRALEAYNEYIVKFPESDNIPSALLRVGNIYDNLGDNNKARITYLRLINNHPESIYVSDAKLKVLEDYFKQGLFEDVINYSSNIFSENPDNLSGNYLSKAYTLVGDAQIALSQPSDALVSFFNAGSRNTENGNEIIDTKLNNAFSQLEDNDINFLIESTKDNNLKGYLLYRIGVRYYETQKYKEAETVFKDLIKQIPGHENVKEAKIYLQKIYKNSEDKVHTIGCLLPLTGAFSVFGNKALKGVKLALSRFSDERGEILLNLVVRDTGSDPAGAARAVEELVKEDACAIIGPMGTDESAVAAKEAQKAGIPIILMTQKKGITDSGNFVFRNFLVPEMQVKSIVKYAIEKKGIKRFAILYPRENYGTKFTGMFYAEVMANGGTVVNTESYDPSLTDYTDVIKKFIGVRTHYADKELSGPAYADEEQSNHIDNNLNEKNGVLLDFEAVFIPDSPAKAGLIIPQFKYNDVKNIYLLGTNLWHSKKMIKMAGDFMQDKAIIPDGYFGEKDSDKMRNFVNSFLTYYGEEPGFIEAIAYDTAMMLFQTVSKPGIRFPESVRNELVKIKNFDGLTGSTSFDGKQDAQKELYLITVKGDSFVEIDKD